MNGDWSYPLDMCASAGIIDYDAAADIMGKKPRFIGNPKMTEVVALNPIYLPDNPTALTQPEKDLYESPEKNNELIKNPTWKKVLLGGLTALGIGAGIVALVASKGKIKIPSLAGAKTAIKNFGSKTWSYMKKPFSAIKGLFKKPSWTGFKTKMKSIGSTIWGYMKKPFSAIKGLFKKPSWTGFKTKIKNIGSTTWAYIKKPFVYIKGLFTKKP